MKIVELRASNFARLSAVAIRPDGALVQITGANGQGKTSCLNAIWAALKGRAAAPAQPIKTGAEEARIKLDLGEMVILRSFKRSKAGDVTTDLKITMAGGARVSTKPQAMIDALLGDLSFNPLEFARLPAKEQFERVKQLVPNFDFEANAAQRQQAFDERTVANRKCKDAIARADGIKLPPGKKPDVPSMGDLTEQLRQGNVNNRNIENVERQRALEQVGIDNMFQEAERLRAEANTLEKRAHDRSRALNALPTLPDYVDTDSIAAQIASVDELRKIAESFEARANFTSTKPTKLIGLRTR